MTLEALLSTATFPDQAVLDLLLALKNLHQSKLYFEYQTQLEKLVFAHPNFNSAEIVTQTLAELQTNLDALVLLRLFDTILERRGSSVELANQALEDLKKIKPGFEKTELAVIFINILEAKYKYRAGDIEAFLNSINEIEKQLLLKRSVPKVLYSYTNGLRAEYLWSKKEYGKYFSTVLRHLAYTDQFTLSVEKVTDLAEKAIISALISDELLSFNEIISNETFSVLGKIPQKAHLWELANIFNAGDIDAFSNFLNKNAEKLKNSPLEVHLSKIQRNIRVVALFDHVFFSPKSFSQQHFTFQEIANISKLSKSEVEPLLIYILSIELMEGFIDEEKEVFYIGALKPRVLDKGRIAQLKEKFQAWGTNVGAIQDFVKSC